MKIFGLAIVFFWVSFAFAGLQVFKFTKYYLFKPKYCSFAFRVKVLYLIRLCTYWFIFHSLSFFSIVTFVFIQSKKYTLILEQMSKTYQSARSGCISETGVDEGKVQILEAAELVDDKKINCYVGCIMKKMDMVSFNCYWKT